VLNLRLLNQALRLRWLWLQKTMMDKPWDGLEIGISDMATGLGLAALRCTIGNGRRASFWRDPWLNGRALDQRAPNLLSFVRPAGKRMSVAEALHDHAWVDAIRGSPTVPAIAEFLEIWEEMQPVTLSVAPDAFAWRLGAAGKYSSRDTYAAFFLGRELAPCADHIWRSWAPLEVKIFAWLAVRARLWTADRLARRNMPHTRLCQLCCQQDEDTTHMLLGCAYAREVWYNMLLPLRLHRFTPDGAKPLAEWWPQMVEAVPAGQRRHLNTSTLATLRFIWLERNSRVFEHKASPAMATVALIRAELRLWILARVEGGHPFQIH
jgi:hypothetical protein